MANADGGDSEFSGVTRRIPPGGAKKKGPLARPFLSLHGYRDAQERTGSTRISTRRLSARPESVSLLAIG